MTASMREIDERTNLAGTNKFELLLFKLGTPPGMSRHELFGINVFKVREIMAMPSITAMVNAPPNVMGVINLRGQILPVIDLPKVVGCVTEKGPTIVIVTEFARTTQAFAVEEVDDIMRLEWKHVLSAEGQGGGLVTSIARLDGDAENTRLAQVLDVEQILRDVMPEVVEHHEQDESIANAHIKLPPGTVVLAADDSLVARNIIEQGLKQMGVPFIMTKTGKEAWDKLQQLRDEAEKAGKKILDKVALVLTDLEMPEMDGFTLTRNIKNDPRYMGLPVIIHSSLTGSANESHVKTVGADAYIAKFNPTELAATLRDALSKRGMR